MSYEILVEQAKNAGLMRKTYVAYALYTALVLLGIATSIRILMLSDSLIVQTLNALFFGFVFVQAGMLGHDLSHKQVFKSERVNKVMAVIVWCFLCGLSAKGWYEKHNAHHKHVNHVGEDPDLNIPFIFSEKQMATTPAWVKRYILPHQSWLFFVMLPLVYPNFVLWTMKNIVRHPSKEHTVEAVLIVLHFIFFFGLPLYFLPPFIGLFFCLLSLLVCGAYMGIVFAPNHKGEEVIDDRPTIWTDQITLTRNLHPTFIGFHFFGGLDLQIEHHLFPSMSRFMYPYAHKIVKKYCKEHGLRYYETSWFGSMKEIYVALKREERQREVEPSFDAKSQKV